MVVVVRLRPDRANVGDVIGDAASLYPLGTVIKSARALKRVPKGELWYDTATGKMLKGGQFVGDNNRYLKFGNLGTASFPTTQTTKLVEAPKNVWRERLEALSRFLGIIN